MMVIHAHMQYTLTHSCNYLQYKPRRMERSLCNIKGIFFFTVNIIAVEDFTKHIHFD